MNPSMYLITQKPTEYVDSKGIVRRYEYWGKMSETPLNPDLN